MYFLPISEPIRFAIIDKAQVCIVVELDPSKKATPNISYSLLSKFWQPMHIHRQAPKLINTPLFIIVSYYLVSGLVI